MERKIFILLIVCLFITSWLFSQSKDMYLVEAESFHDKGGWVLDQQFMDQMGSPFLLAHGLGKPVANAKTEINLPQKGEWHVYVRTWNWCAPWTTEAPGRFLIEINGKTLSNELGTGKMWNWEYAGDLNADKIENNLEIKDLTGFEGRCDAILFTRRKDINIPNKGDELYQFRKKLLGIPEKAKVAGNYDLVVVGAGTAGLSTAIAASRQGMKVALINNRPVPGGNNSKEIQVVVSGALKQEPYPRLGAIVEEIGNIYKNSDPIDNILKSENNLSYYPNMHVFKVNMKNAGKIESVIAKHIETSEELIFQSPLFVDCTGDANIGYLAGAEFRIGREKRSETREGLAPDHADNMSGGATVFWDSKKTDQTISFPICRWAIQFTDESCENTTYGHGFWEAGFKMDQINEAEYIRDLLFRAIYGNWAFLKNNSKNGEEFKQRELVYMAYIAGKRESRRLMGDVLFRQMDIDESQYTKYDDAIVTGTYSIDQHFPDPKNSYYFPGQEFKSLMKHNYNDLGIKKKFLTTDQVNPPYRIPYRCLYSVNIDNLFMAGRNISVTHVALGSTRVQGTTGMMGELVGYGASLCKKYNCMPRDIYKYHLEELKSLLK